MRVWLVDDKRGDKGNGLEALLRQLEARAETEVQVVGVSDPQPDFLAAMRKLVPDLLDLILINESVWPQGEWTEEILKMGLAVVVVTSPNGVERFRPLMDQYPIAFAPSAITPDGLWLALYAAAAGLRRHLSWQTEMTRLQQRLQDRILIERAKGLLVQRLGINEEEAYRRIRVQSRRQRRQIREIAQMILDSQLLFLPESNGLSPRSEGRRTEPTVAAEQVVTSES